MRYRFLRFPDGKAKALTISYDDGCQHDVKLVEIINRYGIKGTFNLNSSWFGTKPDDWHLSAERLGEILIPAGHEIAVHGAKHVAPGKVSTVDGIVDVLEGRRGLEQAYGRIIRGMAYPDSGIRNIEGGASLEQIKTYLKSLGIVYARTLGRDTNNFSLPDDWYEWMPTAHHSNPKLMEFLDEFLTKDCDKLTGTRRGPMLFYMWGHSYEFANADNWDLLEGFCKKASGHDDVWYATNIEIYDYVTAYRSLIFSVDNTIAFNPTLFTVWFDMDGTLYSIKPGETLKI